MSAAVATPLSSSEVPPSKSVREIKHWISGAAVAGQSGRFSDVFHPASGRVQARVPLATDAELNAAVAAAAAAFPSW